MKRQTDKKSIKHWSEEDRPREKLTKLGAEALSNSELLAIIMGSGNLKQSAVELARDILSSCDNKLNLLGQESFLDLMEFRGVGQAKAISIVAALEIGKRRAAESAIKKNKVLSSKDIFEYFNAKLVDKQYEEFWIVFMNNAQDIIDTYKLSQGGTTATVIDVKLVVKRALSVLAQSLILVHNHPSGNIKPSSNDIKITEKIKTATEYFDIKLLDHIITGGNNYYSFADEGII